MSTPDMHILHLMHNLSTVIQYRPSVGVARMVALLSRREWDLCPYYTHIVNKIPWAVLEEHPESGQDLIRALWDYNDSLRRHITRNSMRAHSMLRHAINCQDVDTAMRIARTVPSATNHMQWHCRKTSQVSALTATLAPGTKLVPFGNAGAITYTRNATDGPCSQQYIDEILHAYTHQNLSLSKKGGEQALISYFFHVFARANWYTAYLLFQNTDVLDKFDFAVDELEFVGKYNRHLSFVENGFCFDWREFLRPGLYNIIDDHANSTRWVDTRCTKGNVLGYCMQQCDGLVHTSMCNNDPELCIEYRHRHRLCRDLNRSRVRLARNAYALCRIYFEFYMLLQHGAFSSGCALPVHIIVYIIDKMLVGTGMDQFIEEPLRVEIAQDARNAFDKLRTLATERFGQTDESEEESEDEAVQQPIKRRRRQRQSKVLYSYK